LSQVCREAWSAFRPTVQELPLALGTAIPLFILSLAVTLAAARLFASRLDRVGSRFGFPEALVGLLTALAADGPEISSALFALARGEHAVSVGVLVGSNAFNLAAMIGASTLLAGSVRLARDTLLLEGLVGSAVTLIGAALLLGWLAPAAAAGLATAVLLPYLLAVIGGSELLARRRGAERLREALAHRRGAERLLGALAHTLERRPHAATPHASHAATPHAPPPASSRLGDPAHHLLGLIALDAALIVAGSAGMVQAALALGGRWGVSSAILGTLVLAPLTSLPNAITAIRLGLADRGAALVAETFNSNTINLAVGVILPSLFVTLAASQSSSRLQLAWLVGMTLLTIAMLAPARGMRRPQAAVLIALYGGFVAIQLAGA
jgi:cation:H+ antiporter